MEGAETNLSIILRQTSSFRPNPKPRKYDNGLRDNFLREAEEDPSGLCEPCACEPDGVFEIGGHAVKVGAGRFELSDCR